MRIALQLDTATTAAVRARVAGEGPTARGEQTLPLDRVVALVGALVQPVHPDATDALLMPWFFIEVPDDVDVAALLDTLQSTPGVEAAYVEPPASPPLP